MKILLGFSVLILYEASVLYLTREFYVKGGDEKGGWNLKPKSLAKASVEAPKEALWQEVKWTNENMKHDL